MANDKLRAATYNPLRLAPPAIVSSTVLHQAWCPLCSWETDQLVDIREAEAAADAHRCPEVEAPE